jgi:hypothetical protein
VTLPPEGSPCSLSVSRTEPIAVSGTGRSFSFALVLGSAFRFAGSVAWSQAASALAGSIVPSASTIMRPALAAFITAT